MSTLVNVLQQGGGDSRRDQQEGKRKEIKETTAKLYYAKIAWTHIL